MASEKSIFLRAVNIDSLTRRMNYLDQACVDDAQIRDRVERLLTVHDDQEERSNGSAAGYFSSYLFQGSVSASRTNRSARTDDVPLAELYGRPSQDDFIGPYQLIERIGEGGFGVVYMAQQIEPVERRVALKIIKAGMDSKQVIARFRAEQQALAMMDHPCIAKVHDAGTAENGRPYFVMEFVDGVPLTVYCDNHQLTIRQRLELFIKVCHAVQHAHQKGIIHRDLKPNNVLVAEYDSRPVPKVIDFGIAKATSPGLSEHAQFTQLGQIMGTLEYMSPEQAQQDHLEIDTRSDVYALGVLAYELLTGMPPFDAHQLRCASFEEMLRIFREEVPLRPSTRIAMWDVSDFTSAEARCAAKQKCRQLVQGDLDWIVMKALEKDRSRRYATASALADDMQRFLNDQPVSARAPSVVDRVCKFSRRNRTELTIVAVLLILLTTFTVALQAIRLKRAQVAVADAFNQLIVAPPSQVGTILQRMNPHKEAIADRCWKVFHGEDVLPAHRFRAGIVLGVYATFDAAWDFEDFRFLEGFVNTADALDQTVWRDLLGPLALQMQEARVVTTIVTVGEDSFALTENGHVCGLAPRGLGPVIQSNVVDMEKSGASLLTVDGDGRLRRQSLVDRGTELLQENVLNLAVLDHASYTLDDQGTLQRRSSDGRITGELAGGFVDLTVSHGTIYLIDRENRLHRLLSNDVQSEVLQSHVARMVAAYDAIHFLTVSGKLYRVQRGRAPERIRSGYHSDIAASYGSLYLLNQSNELHLLRPRKKDTDRLLEDVKQVAVAAGSVYLLDSRGDITKVLSGHRESTAICRGVARMVEADQSIYVLGVDHSVLRLIPGDAPSDVLQPNVASLAVAGDRVYTLDFSGKLRYLTPGNQLSEVLQENVGHLAVAYGQLFTRDLNGDLRRIQTGHDFSHVLQYDVLQLAVDLGQQLFTRDIQGDVRHVLPDDKLTGVLCPDVDHLAVGCCTRGLLAFDSGGKLWEFDADDHPQRLLSGGYADLIVANDSIYLVDCGRNLRRLTIDNRLSLDVQQGVTKTAVVNGDIYILDGGGKLYRLNSGGESVPLRLGYFSDMQVVHGRIHLLDFGGHMSQLLPATATLQPVQENVQQMGVAHRTLYTLDYGGRLNARYPGRDSTPSLQEGVAEFVVAYDELYTRGLHGQLLRFRSGSESPDVLQSNVVEMAVAVGKKLFTRDANGQLWQVSGSDRVGEVIQDDVAQLAVAAPGRSLYTRDLRGQMRQVLSANELTDVLREDIAQMEAAYGSLLFILDGDGQLRGFLTNHEVTDVAQSNVRQLAVANGMHLYTHDNNGDLRVLHFRDPSCDMINVGCVLHAMRPAFEFSDVFQRGVTELTTAFGPLLFTRGLDGQLRQMPLSHVPHEITIDPRLTVDIREGQLLLQYLDGAEDSLEQAVETIQLDGDGNVISLDIRPMPHSPF